MLLSKHYEHHQCVNAVGTRNDNKTGLQAEGLEESRREKGKTCKTAVMRKIGVAREMW